jgi:hypothetical protein
MLHNQVSTDYTKWNVYRIERGDGPEWQPLQVNMDDIEFLQGLEDLRALANIKDLEWPAFTPHQMGGEHDSSREIWEPPQRPFGLIPAVRTSPSTNIP